MHIDSRNLLMDEGNYWNRSLYCCYWTKGDYTDAKIIDKGFQVCLLEPGDIECHQQTQSLYDGHKPQEIVFQNYRVYLGEGRICHNFTTRFMYSSQQLAQTLTIFHEYFTTSIQDLHIFVTFSVKEKYKPRYIGSPKDE